VTIQGLDIFECGQGRHGGNGAYLFRIYPISVSCYNHCRDFSLFYSEIEFVGVEVDILCLDPSEGFIDVFEHVTLCFEFDDDVIDIDLYIAIDLFLKDFVN
jgi:hypothetical protein